MAEDFNVEGMLDMFIFESEQLLENLQDIVLRMKDESRFDDDSINEIFRVMHTIKGSSGIMMYEDITTVSHKLEDVFYYLRDTYPDNVPHVELVDYVLKVADYITGELDKIKEGETPDGDSSKLVKAIDKFLTKIKSGITDAGEELPPENAYQAPTQFYIPAANAEASKYFRITLHFANDTQMCNIRAYQAVYDLKEIAEDILYMPEDIITNEKSADVILQEGFHMLLMTRSEKVAVRSILEKCSGVEHVDIKDASAQEMALGFSDDTPVGNHPIIINLGDEPAKKADDVVNPGDYVIVKNDPGKKKQLAKHTKAPAKQAFMSVSVEKMDQLMDLIGEMVIAEAAVLENPDLKVPGLDLANFQKAAGQLSKITSDLQDVTMSMRMVSLQATFQKMNRIVFDVSRKLDKDIELEVIGENTEVDKNIIEHISDPLMHLIRNSVDHGIEDKEERQASGKPKKGKITLEAKNESGKVYIIVRDDGKGLDKVKIFNKARQKGLIDSRDISEFSDKEIYQFITFPGFSTNETVTEYSGRGVGMDVVVKNIQGINGTLEIDSIPGQGSEMTMKIPLTLAIINGIVMEAGTGLFVIETSLVKEFVSITEDMIVREPNGEEYIMIRGECYPFMSLAKRYKMCKPGEEKDKLDGGVVIVMEYDGKKVCVLIDRLVAQQEIVVKPIPSYIKKVRGLSGCTQLGDGSVALILDLPGLMLGEEKR